MTLPDFLLSPPVWPTDITITYSQAEEHK